jgi:3-hydroxyisobutyrate dehydrogenase-like beta-hydroxyacid dehydrogenase
MEEKRSKEMRVAILGTGKMGAAMANRLAGQGHQLKLWNRTRSRAEAVGVGEVASTPADAVRDVEAVISMLTDASAVRAAYLGPEGAVKAAGDKVFADMSTAGTDVEKELEAALPAFVEAPVLGSVGAILSGTAVILVGGKKEAVERARPVLSGFGEVRVTGDLGSASALKLIANTMLAGVYALTSELMAAGVAAGVPQEEVFFVLNRIAPLLTQRKAGFVEHRYEPVTFALRDALKDLELAHQLFGRLGVSVPLSEDTRRLFEKAAATHADAEMSAIASLYENQPVRSRR